MSNRIIICLIILINVIACKNDNWVAIPELDSNTTSTEIVKEEDKSTEPEKPKVEEFKKIEMILIDEMNKKFSKLKNYSPEAAMALYAPKDKYAEGNYTYQISTKKINDQIEEIVLLELGLMDDTKDARKILMQVKNKNKIISIQENFKCKKGRGHEDWGTELCN